MSLFGWLRQSRQTVMGLVPKDAGTRRATSYDVPAEVWSKPRSQAFQQFFQNWFRDSWGLTRGDVDLSFLRDLPPDELEVARDLIRRNLNLRQTHFIEGSAALRDASAIPALRSLYETEPDESRRLTIAGSLWKLAEDERFYDCIQRMKSSTNATLKAAHFHQILWLGDERALDVMFDLLDDPDRFVRHLALSSLNELEFGPRQPPTSAADLVLPEYYRARRAEPAFRARLTSVLQSRLRI